MARQFYDFDIINHTRLAFETPDEPLELDYRVDSPIGLPEEIDTRIQLIGTSAVALAVVVAVFALGTYLLHPVVLIIALVLGIVVAVLKSIRSDRQTSSAAKAFLLVAAAPFLIAALAVIPRALPTRWILYAAVGLVVAYIVDLVATHYVYWLLAAPEHPHDTRKHWKDLWAHRFFPVLLFAKPLWLRARRRVLLLVDKKTRKRAADAKLLEQMGTDNPKRPDWPSDRVLGAQLYAYDQRKIDELMAKPKGYLLAFYPLVLVLPLVVIFLLTFRGGIPGFAVLLLGFAFLIGRSLVHSPRLHARLERLAEKWPALKELQRLRFPRYAWRGLLSWHTYSTTIDAPGIFRSPAGSRAKRLLLGGAAIFLLSFCTLPLTAFFPVLLELNPRPWYELYESLPGDSWTKNYEESISYRFTPPEEMWVATGMGVDSNSEMREHNKEAAEYNRNLPTLTANEFRTYVHTIPTAGLLLTFDGMKTGKPVYFLAFLCSLLGSWAFPPLAFLLLVTTTLGYLSLVMFPAIDPDFGQAGERRTDWECYAERLRLSENKFEGRHLWLGAHSYFDYPVLLDREILGEHAYIVGDTGSGKTALGLTPLLVQLIRRADSAFVILDLKGDNALFHAAREEATKAGLRFKHFTNEIGRSTYTFNPFLQTASETLSVNQICENLLEALNLQHGEGYGRSYYSRVARRWLTRALRHHRDIKSFTKLYDLVRQREGFADAKEQQDAFELISVIEVLSLMEQLNAAPDTRAYPKNVLDNAIHMPTVIRENHVVYFWLPAAIESATVREIAKLALYALLSASYESIRGGKKPRTYLFIDEFQRIASANFKVILEQARSFGIGAILANQTMADLNTPDIDLRPTVQTNTRFKQCFSATDLEHQERLMTGSGEALDYRIGITETAGVHPIASSSGQTPYGRITWSEYTRPRLQRNDIIRASDDPFQSIIQIHRGSGYSQLSGFSIPMAVSHMVTAKHYKRRNRAAWPEPQTGTILVKRQQMEPFATTEERLEAAKTVEEKTTPKEGQPDYARQLREVHLEQLRERGLEPAPPPDYGPEKAQ